MTKTITLPDGTTHVLEGTPEEIAKLENLLKQGSVREDKKKKKEVLLGKEEVQKMIDAAILADRLTRPVQWIFSSPCYRPHADEAPVWPGTGITWTYPTTIGDPVISTPPGTNICGGHVQSVPTEVKLSHPPAGTLVHGIPGALTVSNGDGTYRPPTVEEMKTNNPGLQSQQVTFKQLEEMGFRWENLNGNFNGSNVSISSKVDPTNAPVCIYACNEARN